MALLGCGETQGGGGSGGPGATGGAGGMGGVGGMAGTGGIAGSGGSDGGGGMPECQNPEDCDDGNACTIAMCVNGECDTTFVQDGTACGFDTETCQQGSCVGTFACTEQGIRNAIAVGGGPHTFSCGGPTTVMTEAQLVIDHDVILDGQGDLIVQGSQGSTGSHRAFSIAPGVTAKLVAMTITAGAADTQGGGIFNRGTLTVTNSTVSGNRAGTYGGGIYSSGTLTVTSSTVSGNTAAQGGGGIASTRMLTVTNSTVSGNMTTQDGGGIVNFGMLTMTSSTLSGNQAMNGGGISSSGTLTLTNALIEGDCSLFGPHMSGGGNLESPEDTCGFDQPSDQPKVSAGNLKLGPLADNGGPNETSALLPGSVAIDHVEDCVDAEGAPLTTDQRGVARPQGSTCDVGAFELEVGP